jgi:hypothetical protein
MTDQSSQGVCQRSSCCSIGCGYVSRLNRRHLHNPCRPLLSNRTAEPLGQPRGERTCQKSILHVHTEEIGLISLQHLERSLCTASCSRLVSIPSANTNKISAWAWVHIETLPCAFTTKTSQDQWMVAAWTHQGWDSTFTFNFTSLRIG